jgi:hypothetical protein
MLTFHMARMCSGVDVFWRSEIHVSIGILASGSPGRKMAATIGFGLSAMHKVVLGPAG